MSYETFDYDEYQRRRAREKQQRLQEEACGLSTAELLRSLSWQEALSDHSTPRLANQATTEPPGTRPTSSVKSCAAEGDNLLYFS